jgi:hypothetical protein
MCGTELQGPATVRQLTFLRHLGDGPSSQAGRPMAGQMSRANNVDMLSKMASAKGPRKIRGKTVPIEDNILLLSVDLLPAPPNDRSQIFFAGD